MMPTLSIAVVAGARPNFMKITPIVRAFRARRDEARARGMDLRVLIVHTGQHYDENISEVSFRDLEIPVPDRHLNVGSGSHAEQTAKIMVAFEKVLLDSGPPGGPAEQNLAYLRFAAQLPLLEEGLYNPLIILEW